MTPRYDPRSAWSRLLRWDPFDGVPPASLLAESNAEGSPLMWVPLDGETALAETEDEIIAALEEPLCEPDHSWWLLAGGRWPPHEHEPGHRKERCRYPLRGYPRCWKYADHPAHRPDRPLEIWEWADIIETYEWFHALYLLAGGR